MTKYKMTDEAYAWSVLQIRAGLAWISSDHGTRTTRSASVDLSGMIYKWILEHSSLPKEADLWKGWSPGQLKTLQTELSMKDPSLLPETEKSVGYRPKGEWNGKLPVAPKGFGAGYNYWENPVMIPSASIYIDQIRHINGEAFKYLYDHDCYYQCLDLILKRGGMTRFPQTDAMMKMYEDVVANTKTDQKVHLGSGRPDCVLLMADSLIRGDEEKYSIAEQREHDTYFTTTVIRWMAHNWRVSMVLGRLFVFLLVAFTIVKVVIG